MIEIVFKLPGGKLLGRFTALMMRPMSRIVRKISEIIFCRNGVSSNFTVEILSFHVKHPLR
jgi:hypothetical protein